MNKLEKVLLKEIADTQTGPFGTQLHEKDYVSIGTPIVTVEHLGEISFNKQNLPLVSDADKLKLSKYTLKEGDIVFSRVGSVDRCTYVSSKENGWLFSGRCLRVRFNDNANAKYVSFYFRQKFFKEMMLNISVGATMPSLNTSLMANIPLYLPKKEVQYKIASVLSALDSKIEINNHINAELEAMAKTIYDYWFVQFDFPDKNGKPYKSSGGKMDWSEELKREIPEKWENLLLGDVVESTGTGLNPRDNFTLGTGNNYYVTIKNIEQGRVILDNKCDRINDEALEIINKRSDLRVGDILFTSIEPVGITYLILEKPKNWNINESVFTIRPNYDKVTSEFLYMFLSGDYIKSYTKNVAAGSIHKGVRHSVLKDCKFILPAKNIINRFTEIIHPILNKIDLIEKENQQLASLRDWLLPMLMNGQIKLN
jgi:type I restriction enzyme S subunit